MLHRSAGLSLPIEADFVFVMTHHPFYTDSHDSFFGGGHSARKQERELAARLEELQPKIRPRIIAISGETGLGKSSLLARMIHEVAQRNLTKAEVTWTDTRKHDYLATMRAFDRLLGLERLRMFHLNDSRKPLGSRVDRHAHIGHGQLGLEAFL